MDPRPLLGLLVGVAIVWLAFLAIFWLLRPRGVAAREIAGIVPDVLRLIRSVIADRDAPLDVRVVLVGLLLWIVSPIDLIPEFIPVLGPLDDVVVAIVAMRYVRRRLGSDELERHWGGTADGFGLLTSLIGR